MQRDEKVRLEAVREFLQVDFDKMKELQEIVDLAPELCEKPVALITLLDKKANWLKMRRGVDAEEMPRETSFCQYRILQDDVMVVQDATKDCAAVAFMLELELNRKVLQEHIDKLKPKINHYRK